MRRNRGCVRDQLARRAVRRSSAEALGGAPPSRHQRLMSSKYFCVRCRPWQRKVATTTTMTSFASRRRARERARARPHRAVRAQSSMLKCEMGLLCRRERIDAYVDSSRGVLWRGRTLPPSMIYLSGIHVCHVFLPAPGTYRFERSMWVTSLSTFKYKYYFSTLPDTRVLSRTATWVKE